MISVAPSSSKQGTGKPGARPSAARAATTRTRSGVAAGTGGIAAGAGGARAPSRPRKRRRRKSPLAARLTKAWKSRRSAFGKWLARHHRATLAAAALLALTGAVALVVALVPGAYERSGLAALFGPKPAASTITGSVEADKTVLGCVRGATASALSAAVPAAPLAATGVLIPGSAALVATASAIGCGVGAASTTTTSGFEYLLKQGRAWWAGWFGS